MPGTSESAGHVDSPRYAQNCTIRAEKPFLSRELRKS